MKISNSKKKLARIISENGGWPRNADWAAQCKSDSTVSFYYGIAPYIEKGDYAWYGDYLGAEHDIDVEKVLPNWRQTVLANDEYFHLYPAPDADGWVEYCGTERPLGVFAEIIDVRLYDGRVLTDFAGRFEWNTDGNARIVAYRLSKQEQAKSNAVGDDETNLAAKEELEALEFSESPEQRAKLAKIYAPSIEQLAADYHSKLAIAKHAQEEADSHRCGAEAALERLYQAGLLIGLDIAIAGDELELQGEREESLNITDWRDLQVGDIVECINDNIGGEYNGEVGEVLEIDTSDHKTPVRAKISGGDYGIWCHEVKFISRP